MKVLVIGDLIEDVFHYGTALGLSAETPTIVMRREKTVQSKGGAGLVVRHLTELGVDKVELLSDITVRKERFMVDGVKLLLV